MKILFLHKQILFPRDTGGKIRVLNLLVHLGKRHAIDYVCTLRPGEEIHLPAMRDLGLNLETVPAREPRRGSPGFYAQALRNLAASIPYNVARNTDPALRERCADLIARRDYDLVICDTVIMVNHLLNLAVLSDATTRPALILFQHNVESQILKRHAEVAGNPLKRAYMAAQYRRMVRFEAEAGRAFDRVIAVSEADRQTFMNFYGWDHVDAIETSVDLDYFQPWPQPRRRDRVVFVGSMDWMPNQDGVRRFLKTIWPRIRQARPEATFQVVGRRPPLEFTAGFDGRDGVEVVGTVPDVRPYLAEASVAVVPLWVGGGTRLKIYEAMAMATPVVSTAIGAEGLPLTPGHHYLQANDDATFAQAVADLLANPDRAHNLGRIAHTFVASRFGTEPIAAQFEGVCQRTLETRTSSQGVGPPMRVRATISLRKPTLP